MQLRSFVIGSSVILLGWLAATFFHQVPSQRYRKLDKYAAVTSPALDLSSPPTVGSKKSTEFAVSTSR